MFGIEFTMVDKDLYVPIELSTAGSRYVPDPAPAGWQCLDTGPWTSWRLPEQVLPAQGWKVHVSAQLARAQYVLDAVSRVCVEHRTPFKHVRTDEMFVWLHHKHGPRTQSGKFCTAYPADESAARQLMQALDTALAGESGPYVLTDRRFADSSVVSYRYGGFTSRSRTEPDGTRTSVITGVDGEDVADNRKPQFVLPSGIADPFGPPPDPVKPGPVTINGYMFTAVLQFSNAGGAYRAAAPDGRTVFVKEARKDNGYQWDRTTAIERLRREHDTLTRLHAVWPGVCPAPLDYFRHWEHEFLVTELVPGMPLNTWTSRHHPLVRTGAGEVEFHAYYLRCRAVLGALRDQLRRLHAVGYAFIDLSPRNILVDDDDRPRLVDFEEAQPLNEPRPAHGADGFLPPRALRVGRGSRYVDAYALGSIAEALVNPVQGVLERNPAAVAHVLAALPALPPDLRRAARRLRRSTSVGAMPGPDEVAKAPLEWLSWLAERIANGMTPTAGRGALRFPLAPPAHATNPHCLAHGSAGVLYALHRAGYPASARVVQRFCDEVLAEVDSLPPGLFAGTAGVALVLAELGRVEEARTLLAAREVYPLAGRDATLASGTAGVALAHLAISRHDGDPYHVTRAAELLASVPDGPDVVPLLGPDESTGWAAGRPGIALALYYLSRHGGGDAALHRGLALLLADLEQSYEDGPGLLFHVSRRDGRVEPYLSSGSAGFALVAGRYLTAGTTSDGLASAYRRSLATLGSATMTALPSLMFGLAGIGLVLSDLAGLTGLDQLRAGALRVGQALFRYVVPHQDGIGFLGPGNRFSADLSWGSAGVLLFLAQLLDGRPDALFTCDGPSHGTAAGRAPRRSPPAGAKPPGR